MNMPTPTYLTTVAQLKNIFRIDELAALYKDYQPMLNRRAGFTVTREYPKNLRYKPLVTSSGDAVTCALIGVVYGHPNDTRRPINGTRVPIYIWIDLHNKYLSTHHEYDYGDPYCPTEESVLSSASSPKPASFETSDDLVFDHQTNTLISKKGKVVSGKQVLDEVFAAHCNTIHRIKGLGYRSRKRFRGFSIRLFERLEKLCSCLLRLLGYSILPKTGFDLLEPYKKEDLKEESKKDINFFGYKTSKNIVIVFSLLFVCFYFLLSLREHRFFDKVVGNSLMSACLAILLLASLEFLIPRFIFYIHNSLFKKRIGMMLRGIRV